MTGEDSPTDIAVMIALENIIEGEEWEDWKAGAIRMQAILNVARTLPTPSPHLIGHYATLTKAVLAWRLQRLAASLPPEPPDQHQQSPPKPL